MGEVGGQGSLFADKGFLPRRVFFLVHRAFEVHIQQAIQPRLDVVNPRRVLRRQPLGTVRLLRLPLVNLGQNPVGHLARQGAVGQGGVDFQGKRLLPDILFLVARAKMARAVVVMVPLLPLRRDTAPARAAFDHPREKTRIALARTLLRPAPLVEHPLHAVEHFAGNQRFMRPLVQFPFQPEHADIEGIGQKAAHPALPKMIVPASQQAHPVRHVRDGPITRFAARVGLEQLLDQRRRRLVDHDGAQARLVQIADGRAARIPPQAQFLADTAFYILAQVVHIVLALAERDGKHELPLGRVLEPERRELQRRQLASVH